MFFLQYDLAEQTSPQLEHCDVTKATAEPQIKFM